MSPVIRRALPTDVAELTQCQTVCYREAFAASLPPGYLDDVEIERGRHDAWIAFLEAGGDVWIAVEDSTIVGFTSSGASRGDGQPVPLELMTLYVRSGQYGTGLADRLFEASIGEAAAMLWVWDGNVRARAYYARRNFVLDGGEKVLDTGVRLLRMVR